VLEWGLPIVLYVYTAIAFFHGDCSGDDDSDGADASEKHEAGVTHARVTDAAGACHPRCSRLSHVRWTASHPTFTRVPAAAAAAAAAAAVLINLTVSPAACMHAVCETFLPFHSDARGGGGGAPLYGQSSNYVPGQPVSQSVDGPTDVCVGHVLEHCSRRLGHVTASPSVQSESSRHTEFEFSACNYNYFASVRGAKYSDEGSQ